MGGLQGRKGKKLMIQSYYNLKKSLNDILKNKKFIFIINISEYMHIYIHNLIIYHPHIKISIVLKSDNFCLFHCVWKSSAKG